jgi:hypothetical protein
VQTVGLSGISAGSGEQQTLTVTASSSNPAVIPKPAVSYRSPNATVSLSFTPVANAVGWSDVTVTVKDSQTTNNSFPRTFRVTVDPIPEGTAASPAAGAALQSVSASFVGIVGGVAYESPSGPGPLDVTFDAGGSSGPNPIVRFRWDFGDGAVSDTASETAPHRYVATGSYFVTLTVTDSVGDADSTQLLVSVADAIQTVATAAELQAALDLAAANGLDDIVRLAGGVYTLSGNGDAHFTYSSTEDRDLVVEGGWTPDFSQRAANIPTELRNDVLVPIDGSGGVLAISAGGNVTVDGLTISGGNAAGNGGGLSVASPGAIVIGNCSVRDNTAVGEGGGLFLESTAGSVRLHGNSITGNSAGSGGGGSIRAVSAAVLTNDVSGNSAVVADGGLQASVASGGELRVSNNTIYANRSTAGASGLSVTATGTEGISVLEVRNNIVYGNAEAPNFLVAADCDYALNHLDLYVANNDIESYQGCPDIALDGSNFAADFSGRAAGDIRLSAADGALIDQGAASGLPPADFEGDALPLDGNGDGSAVPDIGADEYDPENVDAPSSMTVAASGSIASPGGSATITVMLDKPAKRDTVLSVDSGDTSVVTVASSYLKIFKGLSSARAVVQAPGSARSGASTITARDPSGWIAQGSVIVSVEIAR